MNHFKSYQIQAKNQNQNKNQLSKKYIYIRKFNLNDSSLINSKENIKNTNNSLYKNNSQYSEPKFSYNYFNKNFYSKNKKIKFDKIIDTTLSFINLKKNGKFFNNNLDFCWIVTVP